MGLLERTRRSSSSSSAPRRSRELRLDRRRAHRRRHPRGCGLGGRGLLLPVPAGGGAWSKVISRCSAASPPRLAWRCGSAGCSRRTRSAWPSRARCSAPRTSQQRPRPRRRPATSADQLARLLEADAADRYLLDGDRGVFRCVAYMASTARWSASSSRSARRRRRLRGGRGSKALTAKFRRPVPHPAYDGLTDAITSPFTWSDDVRGVPQTRPARGPAVRRARRGCPRGVRRPRVARPAERGDVHAQSRARRGSSAASTASRPSSGSRCHGRCSLGAVAQAAAEALGGSRRPCSTGRARPPSFLPAPPRRPGDRPSVAAVTATARGRTRCGRSRAGSAPGAKLCVNISAFRRASDARPANASRTSASRSSNRRPSAGRRRGTPRTSSLHVIGDVITSVNPS